MHFFSVAQCFGYLAFILGVTAFLQKSDRRLKGFLSVECLVYALHFWMLDNIPASLSAFISSCRSSLALKTRSLWVAGFLFFLNLGLGLHFAKGPTACFPVIASCLGTVAIFLMRGIPMRVALLIATFCWLANNILTGSIGGTLLESVIAVTNSVTMARLLISARKPGASPRSQAKVAASFPPGRLLPD